MAAVPVVVSNSELQRTEWHAYSNAVPGPMVERRKEEGQVGHKN